MKRSIVFILIFPMVSTLFGQTFIFTAINDKTHVQLDSIKIINLTNDADTMLFWPDTILVLNQHSGIASNNQPEEYFKVWQNYPNPVTSFTSIALFVPGKDLISVTITDILGRVIINSNWELDRGLHSFRFIPGSGNIFFFSARWRDLSQSVKILNSTASFGQSGSLTYIGLERSIPALKTTLNDRGFPFSIGDKLLLIGYADSLQSGQVDDPGVNKGYAFQFATNISCPGTPTVTYEGQVYNTIQIFSQCWLKENLNVGVMILGTIEQSDNGTIEKYCYKNEPDSCAKNGGLYQWNEIMHYTIQEGTRGICPPGWHIPADVEWNILEGAVDSDFGIGDPEWDKEAAIRGFDAGVKLRSTSGWFYENNGTDLFGFTVLPAGYLNSDGYYVGARMVAAFWPSTMVSDSESWSHIMDDIRPGVGHGKNRIDSGYGVRCLKDD